MKEYITIIIKILFSEMEIKSHSNWGIFDVTHVLTCPYMFYVYISDFITEYYLKQQHPLRILINFTNNVYYNNILWEEKVTAVAKLKLIPTTLLHIPHGKLIPDWMPWVVRQMNQAHPSSQFSNEDYPHSSFGRADRSLKDIFIGGKASGWDAHARFFVSGLSATLLSYSNTSYTELQN